MTDITVPDVQGAASIVRLAVVGDEAAFAQLIAAHSGAMTRVAYVVTGDWDIARDAVQAAWAIAWRRLRSAARPGPDRAVARGHRGQRGTPADPPPATAERDGDLRDG
jgi:hypothetical protein